MGLVSFSRAAGSLEQVQDTTFEQESLRKNHWDLLKQVVSWIDFFFWELL